MPTERLLEFAETVKGAGKKKMWTSYWRNGQIWERLKYALVKGIIDFIDQDTEKRALNTVGRCMWLKAFDGQYERLMGDLFGPEKCFCRKW